MTTEGLERLDTWRKARNFTVQVYHQVLPLLPAEEKWGLVDQLRRSSQSIPANLAEGYGRFYFQETIRFAYIARGSLNESLSHLALACKLGFVPDAVHDTAVQNGEEVYRLISGYIAYLKKSRKGEKEPGAPRSIAEDSADYGVDPEILIPENDPGLEL